MNDERISATIKPTSIDRQTALKLKCICINKKLLSNLRAHLNPGHHHTNQRLQSNLSKHQKFVIKMLLVTTQSTFLMSKANTVGGNMIFLKLYMANLGNLHNTICDTQS